MIVSKDIHSTSTSLSFLPYLAVGEVGLEGGTGEVLGVGERTGEEGLVLRGVEAVLFPSLREEPSNASTTAEGIGDITGVGGLRRDDEELDFLSGALFFEGLCVGVWRC